MTVNKVILIGNVGRDPDVRLMPDKKAVANVSLCTSETWKDAAGQSKSREEWHRLVFLIMLRGLQVALKTSTDLNTTIVLMALWRNLIRRF